jgi:hypothetical protein
MLGNFNGVSRKRPCGGDAESGGTGGLRPTLRVDRSSTFQVDASRQNRYLAFDSLSLPSSKQARKRITNYLGVKVMLCRILS